MRGQLKMESVFSVRLNVATEREAVNVFAWNYFHEVEMQSSPFVRKANRLIIDSVVTWSNRHSWPKRKCAENKCVRCQNGRLHPGRRWIFSFFFLCVCENEWFVLMGVICFSVRLAVEKVIRRVTSNVQWMENRWMNWYAEINQSHPYRWHNTAKQQMNANGRLAHGNR